MYFQFIRQILLLFITFCNISNVIGQTISVAQYVQTTANLTTLSQIISSPGSVDLLALLNGPAGSKITLFAPTDGAFTGIDRTDVAFILNLVKYHTVPDRGILSNDLTSNMVVNTLLNDSSLINLPFGQAQVLYLTKSSDGNISINNNNGNTSIKVIQKDIQCSNGVVHIIDTVVIPPRSLIDTANSLQLTQFIKAFTDAGLLTNSNTSSGITIFVPSNDAFVRSNISSMDSSVRKALLQHHVIVGQVIYEIKDGMNADQLHFTVNDTTYVNNVKVIKSDVLLQNGVMYLINNVLSFNNNSGNNGTKTGVPEDNANSKMDTKLIIGAVLGTICGAIVITLFSCVLYKWYRAQRNVGYHRNI